MKNKLANHLFNESKRIMDTIMSVMVKETPASNDQLQDIIAKLRALREEADEQGGGYDVLQPLKEAISNVGYATTCERIPQEQRRKLACAYGHLCYIQGYVFSAITKKLSKVGGRETWYIIAFNNRQQLGEGTSYLSGGIVKGHLLGQSTSCADNARRFDTYEQAARSALTLANYEGEDYRFRVIKMKGGQP